MREKKKNRKKTKGAQKSVGNREFVVVTYFFLMLFLLMMGYVVYFQLFRSEDIINSPYNKRQDSFAAHVIRGSVLSADKKVLAETIVNEDGSEIRYYPYGNMFAHVIGYDVNGKAGVESIANFSLLRSNAFFVERIINELQGKKSPGDSVITTLDYELQETAYHALGNSHGAVIVLEPSTGKILAMVSKPDYNPNTIALEWDAIVSDKNNSVLLNRGTQGLYPPGSTFKIFTTLAYVRENPQYAQYLYECSGSITEGGFEIHCAKNKAHGQEDLKMAFAKSCNSAYANIGLSLNYERFAKLCDSLLFNTNMPTSFPFKKSSFVLNGKSEKTEAMMTAIGQGETLMTPMHLALITAAIANNGVLMEPYVIDHTENDNGVTVKKYEPATYGVILNRTESVLLQEYMEYTVTNGTARALSGKNYTAAGKTGSAEYSDNKEESHAWFTGFATREDMGEIVVTIIVEGGGTGSDTAVPVAEAIFDAYFH